MLSLKPSMPRALLESGVGVVGADRVAVEVGHVGRRDHRRDRGVEGTRVDGHFDASLGHLEGVLVYCALPAIVRPKVALLMVETASTDSTSSSTRPMMSEAPRWRDADVDCRCSWIISPEMFGA